MPDTATAAPAETPTVIRREEYSAPAYAIESLALAFDLEPEATRVKSRLAVAPVQALGSAADVPPLRLDGEAMKLLSIELDGEPLAEGRDYQVDGSGLTVTAPPQRPFTLEVETEIDPKGNSELSGLYLSNGVFCTQCEAEGFRRITYFPDRPDVLTRYHVTIRGPKESCPVLLSNGNLADSGDLPDGRHYAVWDDPFPKPSYLFALVAGDLACHEDSFTTRSGREVALRIHVEHGKESRTGWAMDSLKRSMRWDETRFGLEYDLDLFNIVAVSDFNMGAMENKSLNVFNDKYILADPDTATDTDYAGIESVVAHEYFHNWTGNRVTCRDWFQLSLKEGLTVFRDQEFSSDVRSRPVERIQTVRALRARQFPEDAGPLAHPVRPDSYIEINNFYTPTVYEKGAEVIRMQHSLLGEEGFQKGMRLYIERHDGQAATCDDFVAAMADANDVDLEQFKLWYAQAGTPELQVEGHYDSAAGAYEMTVRQHCPPTPGQPEKKPMQIPFAVGLLDAQGQDIPLKLEDEEDAAAPTRVLDLRQAEQRFRFPGVPEPRAVSLNRGFSAPVNLKSEQSPEELAFLMAQDSDPFARWEAGQRYALNLLLQAVEQIQNGGTPSFDAGFVEAFREILRDPQLDKAFAAEALALPGESYIGEQLRPLDVEAIHQAREALRRHLAEALAEDLQQVYAANQVSEAYSPEAEQAGQRALRNTALSYLSSLAQEDEAALSRLAAHYHDADNMTDRMAALRLLVDIGGEVCDTALQDFHDRYREDALVMDKWLALQAVSARPDTLERVRALEEHPVFSLNRPNKVRALIGTFVSGNPLRYHAADGSGYRFHADRVLTLDGINAQIAARLLTPLGRWASMGEERQRLMKAELERILAAPDLSRDVYEIASKSLDG
ncbi:aminopeptidase N [Fodinicurvata fenggangensis]|uniref:aminopeptidase N n=1 Tax=Fodinicurvata fenggangensis TaxID=1121830 RepID=UPI000691B374|nr:aminopeptidase N [Fodinicurvata fenggangensis]